MPRRVLSASHGRSHSKRARHGSTLVEFALILPILLAMLLGIIEFGWLAKNHLALANAAREGARAASLGKSTKEISTRVRGGAAGSGVGGANDTTRLVLNMTKDEDGAPYTYPTTLGDTGSFNDAKTGSMIRIQVVYQHRSLTNFIPFLNKTLTINVVMRREA